MVVEAEALSPHAAERLCREGAQKSFEESAKSVAIDWHLERPQDRKQVERWAEAIGRRIARQRDAEAQAYKRGQRPEISKDLKASSPANAPQLLVIGLDGGRWQGREKDAQTGSRWREDKVCTVTSYIPGDGKEGPDAAKPQKLLTTHLATTGDCRAFGPLARIEAERRGIRAAEEVIVMGDCGNWIDPIQKEYFGCHARIADYDHAVEHLWEAARAVLGSDSPKVPALADRLESHLYTGQVDKVIKYLEAESAKLGPPKEADGEHHPRSVLAANAGYFKRNGGHMNYPEYRAKGWPIGSGNTEAGVKQFNKRVKGTEQFWSEPGVEAMLALRALWISQDNRWAKFWNSRTAYLSN
jgi:hypothetical protein